MVSETTAGPTVGPEEAINVLLFKDDQDLKPVLTALGLRTNSKGAVRDEEGKPVNCDGCDAAITVVNLGHIMPGSRYFYCTNPACVVKYFVERV